MGKEEGIMTFLSYMFPIAGCHYCSQELANTNYSPLNSYLQITEILTKASLLPFSLSSHILLTRLLCYVI